MPPWSSRLGNREGVVTVVRRFPLGEPHGLTFDPRLDEIRETEPVCRVSLPYGEDAWLVSRYEDVRTVLSDPRFSRAETVVRDVPRTHEQKVPGGIVDLDPPSTPAYGGSSRRRSPRAGSNGCGPGPSRSPAVCSTR